MMFSREGDRCTVAERRHAPKAEDRGSPKFPTEILRGRRFGMPVLSRSLALDKAQGAERLSRTCVRRLREATQQRGDAPKAVDRGPGLALTVRVRAALF